MGNSMSEQADSMMAKAFEQFSWAAVRASLGWPDVHGIDLFDTIIGRHASSHKEALVLVQDNGTIISYSYERLANEASKFASVLRGLGVEPGDRVAGLLPRGLPVVITILAALKLGAVYVPIFTGFRAQAIQYRLQGSQAKVLVTDSKVRMHVPPLEGITVITVDSKAEESATDMDFWQALNEAPAMTESFRSRFDDVAIIIYTSGSTGQPKGGAVAVNFLASVWPYLNYGADLRESDVFWATGDPGWGYGFICYMGALAFGATIVATQSNPAPQTCLSVLNACKVTNLATTPTLLRSIMANYREELEKPAVLRCVSSCGEPLNGEVVQFFRKHWGLTPMDHFGATELSLPVGNFNSVPMDVHPGSMGIPFPGFQIRILDEDGIEVSRNTVGLLAKRIDSDSLYWLYYWADPQTTAEVKKDGWIVTGDLAYQDDDGYFWFKGRQGDIIKSSGYRVGPFEVESLLLKHPKIAEAAVVGKDDPVKGQILKAFVVLRSGAHASDTLIRELQDLVRNDLAQHLYPREVEFIEHMPKTETGKIQRYLLRNHQA